MAKREMMARLKADVKEGKGGFIPFDSLDATMVIFLKRNNYAIEAVREQSTYWYKPNRSRGFRAVAAS